MAKHIKGIFPCSECDRVYNIKTNLRRHIRQTHSGKESWDCDVCGKSFKEPGSVKRHKNIEHLGIRFDCDICGKTLKCM